MSDLEPNGALPEREQQPASLEPAQRLRRHIDTLRLTKRAGIFLNVAFPILLTCSTADAAGFFPKPPRGNPVALGLRAHSFLLHLCTTLCGGSWVMNGRKRRFTEQEIQGMAERGELEDAIRQLWIENPEHREVLKQIILGYPVFLPDQARAGGE
jgi:hypothetical protein